MALKNVIKTDEKTPFAYDYAKEKEEDAKIVKGRFVNHECPGGSVKFHFKKYKGDPIKTYELYDGVEYELPKGVVKHLVQNCVVEEDTNKVKLIDPYSAKPLYEVRKKSRFSFVTSEFLV